METDSASAEASHAGPKDSISNQTIGPETGAIRCLFKVTKRHFIGQRLNMDAMAEWLIRAHSVEEFRAYLWDLARPHVKQAVKVETGENGGTSVCWTDPVLPTIVHAHQYITFNDRDRKRIYGWDNMNSPMIARWDNSNIVVCIYVYTTAIISKNIYDLVQATLLAPRKPKPAGAPAAAKTRKHLPEGADGYNFRDEVRALRETFLQMRDLMHILDNRISLLEEKCDQTVQHEPLISMNASTDEVDVKSYAIPDPLLDEDMKEELADDDGTEDFYQ